MKMIDKEYENFNYNGDRFTFQSKLAEYRKETEAQMQAEMNAKVHISPLIQCIRNCIKHNFVLTSAFDKILKALGVLCFMNSQ